MGKFKELWQEYEHKNPKNWSTIICSECNKSFAFNRITSPLKSGDIGWCDNCWDEIVLKKDDFDNPNNE